MDVKFKSNIVRAFAGGFWKQFACAMCVFIVVFLLSWKIRSVAEGNSKDMPNKVLVEMISPVPYAKDVFDYNGQLQAGSVTPSNQNNAQQGRSECQRGSRYYKSHGGLFWVYFLGSIVFSGLLIAIITNFLRGIGEMHKSGEILYRVSGHTVVLGYGSVSVGLLKHILEKTPKNAFVLLQVTNKVQDTYEQLSVALGRKQMERILLIHANRNNEAQLENRLRVHLAKSCLPYPIR